MITVAVIIGALCLIILVKILHTMTGASGIEFGALAHMTGAVGLWLLKAAALAWAFTLLIVCVHAMLTS